MIFSGDVDIPLPQHKEKWENFANNERINTEGLHPVTILPGHGLPRGEYPESFFQVELAPPDGSAGKGE